MGRWPEGPEGLGPPHSWGGGGKAAGGAAPDGLGPPRTSRATGAISSEVEPLAAPCSPFPFALGAATAASAASRRARRRRRLGPLDSLGSLTTVARAPPSFPRSLSVRLTVIGRVWLLASPTS